MKWKHNFQAIPSKFKVHHIETEPKRHLMYPLTHNTFFYLLKAGTCGWGGRWTLVLWFSTLWVCWIIFIWNLIQCLNIPLKPFIFAFSCTAHKQPWVLRAPRRLHHREAASWTNLGWNLPKTRRKPAIYLWSPDEWPQNPWLLFSRWQRCSSASITHSVPSYCQTLCTVLDRKGFRIWQSLQLVIGKQVIN